MFIYTLRVDTLPAIDNRLKAAAVAMAAENSGGR
jgi:hypothetical protein